MLHFDGARLRLIFTHGDVAAMWSCVAGSGGAGDAGGRCCGVGCHVVVRSRCQVSAGFS
ncbi:hypothetical protein E2C01_064189 [Portunus trituberculatus]|uniref:Uncharacterized protein n=1 Tax=Portunus trituberculatus TaxID=210409 RepID=A0A5B7HJ34_PORTR|nr:hypothetical protein [Portunus trituberculatus]